MVAPVVYLVAAALLVGFIIFLTCSRGRAAAAGREPLHNEEEPVAAGRVAQPWPLEAEEQRAGGRPRRRRDLGSRLQAQRRAQRMAWAEVDENEDEAVIPAQEEEGIEKPVETHLSGKIGAKKLRKLEEKQARKAQREAEEAEREERKRLESQREAEWKKEEERLRLEEEQKEEEERKAREEQAQREHEEYLKLKEAFVVEEEGVGETMTEEQSHSFLTEFINYIKALHRPPVLFRLHKHVLLRFAAKQLLSHKGCGEGRGFQVQLRGAEAAEGRSAEGAGAVMGVLLGAAKEPGLA
ncbi:DDRGK domain-containing protein 1 isoform X2 [Microcebus murinus]|uniref:DDRGK domain-containing protein 1 isoform X2 n=1 Tax=Microcebus murinus TaxID=30608 RepID=UPI003F6A7779